MSLIHITNKGQYSATKQQPRAIVVTLKEEERKKLFKNLHLLRQSQLGTHGADNENKFINIRHDFTTEQMTERREKLAEASAKNDALGPNSAVKYVLRGPPWDQQVKQIRVNPTEMEVTAGTVQRRATPDRRGAHHGAPPLLARTRQGTRTSLQS